MFLHATEESARNRDIVVSNHAASLPSDKMLEGKPGFQAREIVVWILFAYYSCSGTYMHGSRRSMQLHNNRVTFSKVDTYN